MFPVPDALTDRRLAVPEVELVVTVAVRDLFVGRLDLGDGESPVGERVWYRKHGGE